MPAIVDVTVTTAGTTHSVIVVPDPVRIPTGVHGPIQWQITNPPSEGWKFQRQGIDIVNPGSEFDHPTGGGTRVFTWNNNHTKPGQFKCAVRVANDAARAEIDPTIMND
jgi:hypothetical protein